MRKRGQRQLQRILLSPEESLTKLTNPRVDSAVGAPAWEGIQSIGSLTKMGGADTSALEYAIHVSCIQVLKASLQGPPRPQCCHQLPAICQGYTLKYQRCVQ